MDQTAMGPKETFYVCPNVTLNQKGKTETQLKDQLTCVDFSIIWAYF